MIEPTESEGLAELDRFCDAMIAIRAEIDAVADGDLARRRQPAAATLRTPRSRWAATTGTTRTPGRSPAGRAQHQSEAKYWPPVSRIDGGYGDRNLVCSCPPMEDLAE